MVHILGGRDVRFGGDVVNDSWGYKVYYRRWYK